MTQLGIVGVGRMGSQIWRRLNDQSHDALVTDSSAAAVDALRTEGATVAGGDRAAADDAGDPLLSVGGLAHG